MSIFIVKTTEYVAGEYRIEAESSDGALDFLRSPKKLIEGMDSGVVEQTDYMAFAIEVERISGG